MNTDRRIIVYIATSADGYIARGDGSFDFLDRPEIPGHYGIPAFIRSIDTILWGRKTLMQSLERDPSGGELTSGMFGRNVKHYLFSRTKQRELPSAVEQVDEPIESFARRLRSQPGKDIWMMGGASLIGSFLDADAIDAFIIHVIPTIIGEGIPLIEPKRRTLPLRLVSTKKYVDGVLRLHYDVIR